MTISIEKCLSAFGVLAALSLSSVTNAAPIPVFDTGVNALGVVLANGTVGDPHYTLFSAPTGTAATIKVVTSASGYPINPGPWVADSTTSRWIGPNTESLTGPIGLYDYRTTFDLTGMDAATASLTLKWATDDAGSNIMINGVSTGLTAPWTSFSAWETISSHFVAGLNTLDFLVYNQGGPTGLRVEFNQELSHANAVPEPESLALFGLALAGLAVVRRRKI